MVVFKKLYEDLGAVKSDVRHMHEKQDRLLNMLDAQCVKQDEFKLFKKIGFSAASIFAGALAFIFTRVL